MTDEEAEAFLLAEDDDGPSDEELEAFLLAEEPDVSLGESAYQGVQQGALFGFSDEIKGGIGAGLYGAAKGVRALLPGGVPEDAPSVGDVYRSIRDDERASIAAAAEANPVTFGAGAVGGVLASSGVNPVSVVRGAGRSLFAAVTTRPTLAAAGRGLLGAAQGAGKGAGYGALAAAGTSEAEDIAGLASDVAEGAETGAYVGGAAGGLLGYGSAARGAQAQRASEQVATAKAAERENALLKTGLEGKQKTLGGAKRAKERAQALYDEPSPQDPRKTLLEQVEGATPDARLEYATKLRQAAGQELGAIRGELAKVEGAQVSAETLRQQARGAFAELPTEVQAKALEQIDAMIGAAAKDGVVSPAALRKLIEDSEGLAKFGTPNLEAALGNARARVFQAARGVLVGNERELIAKALPERAEAYTEALRKYGVYSDFELGSKVILERANKGQRLLKEPKAEPQPTLRSNLLRAGGAAAGAAVGGAVGAPLGVGGFGAVAGAAAGERAGAAIAERWVRWGQSASVATASARLKKLERLRPMMEDALAKGPAEVARVHAIFMARSPDYRKAIESE